MPRLQFNIKFKTDYGQRLLVVGNLPVLGNGVRQNACLMSYYDAETWQLTINAPITGQKTFLKYKYLLQNQDGSIIAEWGDDRVFNLAHSASVLFYDTWNHAGDYENAFFTTPFQEVLLPKAKKISRKTKSEGSYLFKVKAPLLSDTRQVCIVGSSAQLGCWDTKQPILLTKKDNWWEILVDVSEDSTSLEYKYGIWDIVNKCFIAFEQGENRVLPNWIDNTFDQIVIHDGFIHKKDEKWRGAGVSIPVFSLRSQNSFGIGEFSDIKLLVDWAQAAGIKLIQLLPINDTIATNTWLDSYPYAAISAFALHPIYINLAEIAGTKQAKKLRQLRKVQDQLNQLEKVDYEAVLRIKWDFLWELYQDQSDSCFETDSYKSFFKQNKNWLKSYAAFCYFRDEFGTTKFEKWPIANHYSEELVDELFNSGKSRRKINFYCFVQFHLHQQLIAAVNYAHQKGLVLKGDIPIGIYRYGVDAWVDPSLYNMDWQAGAPPDDFTAIGQNWGFPTYNWKKMQEDGFSWWKQRFEQMSRYFDTFRIDHILGFFRIWSIPTHAVQGILGRFVPCLPIGIDEFTARGIQFDYARFCNPYITDEVLWEIFGEQQFIVREQFLLKDQNGAWIIAPAFDTQLKVEEYFENNSAHGLSTKVKEGLFELIANVLLFEEPGSHQKQFHFRISIDKTWSFKQCAPYVREKLMELYHDYFYRRQDHFWYQEAMQKLPFLKESTNMLICGEDLGMVPHCVPDVMQQTGILSLEIQRMPKDPNKSFFNPADSPYLAVVTPSTHDMSTIRGWWEENRQRTQYFYNHEMHQWGDAPQFCEAWVNRAIVEQHLNSPAMWSIFQIQDLMGMSELIRRNNPGDERINDPANPKNYWQYRMHIKVEELIENTAFITLIRDAIVNAGRA